MPGQSLPFWPHAVALAFALVTLGYASGRVWAPAVPPEPGVLVPSPAAAGKQPAPAAPPQVNVAVFELAASEPLQRIEWPEQAPMATLVLALPEGPQREEYALRVRGEDGGLVLSAEGLKPTRSARLTLAVPRRLMPRGLYAIELAAPGSGPQGAPLHTRRLEIR